MDQLLDWKVLQLIETDFADQFPTLLTSESPFKYIMIRLDKLLTAPNLKHSIGKVYLKNNELYLKTLQFLLLVDGYIYF